MKTIMVFDELENKSTLVELNNTESISKEDMEFYFDDKGLVIFYPPLKLAKRIPLVEDEYHCEAISLAEGE